MTDLKQRAALRRQTRKMAVNFEARDPFMADCREVNEDLMRRLSAYDALPSDVEPQ